jgi:hypothetical protein
VKNIKYNAISVKRNLKENLRRAINASLVWVRVYKLCINLLINKMIVFLYWITIYHNQIQKLLNKMTK